MGQSVGASWWRVCFQRGLPRLVFMDFGLFEYFIFYGKNIKHITTALADCLFTTVTIVSNDTSFSTVPALITVSLN